MAYGIYLPQRWRRLPSYPVAIQQRWFEYDIKSLAAPIFSPNLDVLRGWSMTATNATYRPGVLGNAWVFVGLSTTSTLSTGQAVNDVLGADLAQGTVFMSFRFTDTTTRTAAICGYLNTVVSERVLLQPWNDGNFYFDWGGAVNGSGRAQGAYTKVNRPTTAIGVAGGGLGRRLWYDGRLLASNGSTQSRNSETTQVWRWGDAGGTGTSFCDAFEMYIGATFGRALPDALAKELSDTNGAALFRPANSPVFFSLPSAGAFTLALDAGSYSLTGQDPTLTSARSMALDAGAYNLTGNGVDFNVGRIIYLDAGTYAVTGHDPTLTSARSLALDAGAYSVTGNDVTLVYSAGTVAYSLTLDAGSYSITGLDPTLASNRNLSLDAGSYALTGNDVTFSSALSFPLDTGVYTLSGLPVGLVWSGAPVEEVTDRIITLRSLTERWRM